MTATLFLKAIFTQILRNESLIHFEINYHQNFCEALK